MWKADLTVDAVRLWERLRNRGCNRQSWEDRQSEHCEELCCHLEELLVTVAGGLENEGCMKRAGSKNEMR